EIGRQRGVKENDTREGHNHEGKKIPGSGHCAAAGFFQGRHRTPFQQSTIGRVPTSTFQGHHSSQRYESMANTEGALPSSPQALRAEARDLLRICKTSSYTASYWATISSR